MPAPAAWALPLFLPLLPVAQTTDARPQVVVVEGDFVGPDGEGLRAESAKFARSVREALETACIEFETSSDSTVEKWGLPQTCRVAILPYNRAISSGELAGLLAFTDRGGKLIACYVGPDDLLRSIGVDPGEVVSAESPGQFAAMAFSPGALPLLPDAIYQPSWNVRRCAPRPGSSVLGEWVDNSGAPSGLPAVVLSDSGAFISHVLVSGDDYRKGLLLRAIIAHFVPAILPGVVWREIDRVNSVGRYGTLDRLIAHLEGRQAAGHGVEAPLEKARRARVLRQTARGELAAGNHVAAAEAASAARIAAGEAFYATYPAKPGELRGAWMIYRGRPTWDETMQRLRAANFNAVMPRFCSAGVAYFRSQYLPESSFSQEHGDQLAQATAAARKYGIPLHARMLALFVYESSAEVKAAYRRAGRLMVSADGEVSNEWLCPSNAENRKAVVGACLEMASRYPVAGIQLDYIRYPWKTYCYCPTCKAKFQRDLGVTVDRWPFDCSEGKFRGRFADWRREQITSLVREIRLRLKDLNPDLQFSVDVFVNWEGHRESFGQDWKAWVDEGLLDFACPMDYFSDDDDFAGWVRKQRAWIRYGVPMCVGIGPRVAETALDPQHLLTQIELSRTLGGDGFVLFDYDEVLAEQYLPVVAAGLSSTPSDFSVGPPYLRSTSRPIGGGCRVEYTLATSDTPPPPAAPDRPPRSIPLPEVVVDAARVDLYTADAWPVLSLGDLAADEPVSKDLAVGSGVYRLCAHGTRTRPGGPEGQRFVRWGPLIEVGG